jgi:hypothetical protein
MPHWAGNFHGLVETTGREPAPVQRDRQHDVRQFQVSASLLAVQPAGQQLTEPISELRAAAKLCAGDHAVNRVFVDQRRTGSEGLRGAREASGTDPCGDIRRQGSSALVAALSDPGQIRRTASTDIQVAGCQAAQRATTGEELSKHLINLPVKFGLTVKIPVSILLSRRTSQT